MSTAPRPRPSSRPPSSAAPSPATRWDIGWLEQQYNNRARVPEHPAIFARWEQASALAREKMTCELDIPYGDTPLERLDVFPAKAPGAPVLVFIHGGWWRTLDKWDHSFIAPAFVNAGAAVVVPNYTLCPAVGIDTIVLQMTQALAWTWRHAERFGGDPSRIVAAGHSAGGHLATMMLACDWPAVAADLPADLVRTGLSISGLYDLDPVQHIPFVQPDLKLTPALVERLSPTRYPAPPATLAVAVGARESEEFLRQNTLMRAAWGAAVVPHEDLVPDADHFTVLHELVDTGAPLHRRTLDLLGLKAPDA